MEERGDIRCDGDSWFSEFDEDVEEGIGSVGFVQEEIVQTCPVDGCSGVVAWAEFPM